MKQRMKEYAPILELFVVLDNIHSFIHYEDLYSAPSRLLLRSASDPCTAKKKSFETRVECVRKNAGEQSLRQRKPIPHRGTNHRECTGLGCCYCFSQSVTVSPNLLLFISICYCFFSICYFLS